MKKGVLAVILAVGAVFCAYGQSQPIDLILLLDTSTGMGPSYEAVNSYITGGFLSEFLRIGDTFHLITFSGKPKVDAARRVESRGDIETIIGRMMLQYPFESGNDPRAAIGFAEEYAASLPSRPKKIVMISTGSTDTAALVNAAKQRLGSKNTTFDFVQVTSGQPLAGLPSSGRSRPSPQGQTSTSAPASVAASASAPAAVSTAATAPATQGQAPSTAAGGAASTASTTPQGQTSAGASAAASTSASTAASSAASAAPAA
ncbi:MAG: hypothetical protein LBG91_03030, partial [Treponema sp.]|nr:hypothetical protein [Treponema sp.]